MTYRYYRHLVSAEIKMVRAERPTDDNIQQLHNIIVYLYMQLAKARFTVFEGRPPTGIDDPGDGGQPHA